MVKYKVNIKFKENGKSLNETIINVLKFELEKRANRIYNNSKMEISLESTYSQCERSIN